MTTFGTYQVAFFGIGDTGSETSSSRANCHGRPGTPTRQCLSECSHIGTLHLFGSNHNELTVHQLLETYR